MSEPSIAELLATAEMALTRYLVARSQALQPDGCCAGPEWRGVLCQYHMGYSDGIDHMLEHWGLLAALMTTKEIE